MVRRVLIAATGAAIAAIASCYHPDLVDCVDTCSSSRLCPDGLTCTNGFCRTANGSGTCTGSGSGVDAMGCPPVPQGTMSCIVAQPSMPLLPECFVLCNPPVPAATGLAFHFDIWVPAAITMAQDETDAEQYVGAGAAWIGLHAAAGSGGSAANWSWVDGRPMTYTHWASGQPVDTGAGSNCGVLTGSGWISAPCAMNHPFMIQALPPPR